MAKRIITVTHPDGTKKVIISSDTKPGPTNQSNKIPVKENNIEDDNKRRPKPGTPKISISKEKNGYKYGGKIKLKFS